MDFDCHISLFQKLSNFFFLSFLFVSNSPLSAPFVTSHRFPVSSLYDRFSVFVRLPPTLDLPCPWDTLPAPSLRSVPPRLPSPPYHYYSTLRTPKPCHPDRPRRSWCRRHSVYPFDYLCFNPLMTGVLGVPSGFSGCGGSRITVSSHLSSVFTDEGD